MSIPLNGYPRAAAVSPRLQVAESTGSTNADLVRAAASSPDQWPHLSVLLTSDQRSGRGRLGRTWTAPPGTGLAVSVLVRVADLPVASRGWIPLIAGAAMTSAVRAQLTGSAHLVGLKWPNDVLLDGGKLSGILAEVVPEHPEAVVIGAGVNIGMTSADLPVETATSFAAVGLEVDEDVLLADYLVALDAQLMALIRANGDAAAAGIRDTIHDLCTTVDSEVVVALPDGTRLRGRAERIDEGGRLVIRDGAVETAVSAGDVLHVR